MSTICINMSKLTPFAFVVFGLCLSLGLGCTIPKRSGLGMGMLLPNANRLVEAESPFLREHAHRPVEWQIWDEDAHLQAQEEGKLLLVNLGYAACYPSARMERRAFSDTAIASFINQHFIPIKVDLEERPDLAHFFFNCCRLLNRESCSTPLNVICLPDGRPIFAGSYYGQLEWQSLLEQVLASTRQFPVRAEDLATSTQQRLEMISRVDPVMEVPWLVPDLLEQLQETLSLNLPYSQEPPYPGKPLFWYPPQVYEFLLASPSLDPTVEERILSTLRQLVLSGNYDQLGGGFRLMRPNAPQTVQFEKLLHQNAQMIRLYALAFAQTGDPLFEQVVYESMAFLERELSHSRGGCYASLDAETEREEGRYYLWTLEEIQDLLGPEAELFAAYYQIDATGNWSPGQNLPIPSPDRLRIAQRFRLTPFALDQRMRELRERMMEARGTRARPFRDEKKIVAWNAQVILAYLQAYEVLREADFLETALRHATFIWENCRDEQGELYRIRLRGKSYQQGFLEDYAHTIMAYLQLFEHTFDAQWLLRAEELLSRALDRFYDPVSGMFFMGQQDALVIPQVDTQDDISPSGNALICRALLQLGRLLQRQVYQEMGQQMLANVQGTVLDQPAYHGYWALTFRYHLQPPPLVLIKGEQSLAYRDQLSRSLSRRVQFAGTPSFDASLPGLLQAKEVQRGTYLYLHEGDTTLGPLSMPELQNLLR